MAFNIGGFGLKVKVVASVTNPAGFTITQLAGDTDPFDIPSVQQADGDKGLNGHAEYWSKANVIKVSLAVIPSSTDDKNLRVIQQANVPRVGGVNNLDEITITATYPNGSVLTLEGGVLTDAMPGWGVASAGRYKTMVYGFMFEGVNWS